MPYVAERVWIAVQFGIDPNVVDGWSRLEREAVMVAVTQLQRQNLWPR